MEIASGAMLLTRLKSTIAKNKKIMFLVGSGCSLPTSAGPGVPSAGEIVEEIRQVFATNDDLHVFDECLNSLQNDINEYQKATHALLQGFGQDDLNTLIVKSVLKARNTNKIYAASDEVSLNIIEEDNSGWHLNAGYEAMGRLISSHSDHFKNMVLTTNFDPLIEVALNRYKLPTHTFYFDGDSRFTNAISPRNQVQVVHLHGFWRAGDTLHTIKQLQHSRPLLTADLKKVLSGVTLVVIGYGGWQDIFTKTLVELIKNADESIDVLWAFYDDNEQSISNNHKDLLSNFAKYPNSRVQFYRGVDFNILLPSIEQYLIKTKGLVKPLADNLEVFPMIAPVDDNTGSGTSKRVDFNRYQSDNPPVNPFWIGREDEIRLLSGRSYKACFITGIGGQGKSGLASHFVKDIIAADQSYDFWDWRDCKEEDNRLISVVISLIERVSLGNIDMKALINEKIESLIDLFFECLGTKRGVFVFDNVDHYIDLENFYPSKGLKYLVDAALRRQHHSKFIFTCRPSIASSDIHFLHVQLKPFDLIETKELFHRYSTQLKLQDIDFIADKAHQTTMGHPLWLNLIAAQLQKGKDTVLHIIEDIRLSKSSNSANPSGTLAYNTLNIVWKHLNARQQAFMRGMAETVIAETENHLRQIMSDMNDNHFNKVLKALRSLNLIVVKPSDTGKELYELHPLVKEFMMRKYNKSERSAFIGMWVRLYDQIIMLFKENLTHDSPYVQFQQYLNKIELLINDEKFQAALIAMHEVYEPLLSAGHIEEYQRVATRLFIEIDFEAAIVQEMNFIYEQFRAYVKSLTEVGKFGEAESYLNKLKRVIPYKGTEYIELNDAFAYHFWYKGEYNKAIEYAQIAIELTASTNINQGWSINHTYALALRDSRNNEDVELALGIFLGGESVNELIASKIEHTQFGGDFWGNVGRCLFFQERFSEAVFFYKRSYLSLIKSNYSNAILNRGYACLWLAEVAIALSNFEMAICFYIQCLRYWEKTAPIKRDDTFRTLSPTFKSYADLLKQASELSEWSLLKKCQNYCEDEEHIQPNQLRIA